MSRLLEDEIEWVRNNPHRYEGPYHQKAVINNITKRYRMTEAQKLVDLWAKTKWVKHEHAVLQFFGKGD